MDVSIHKYIVPLALNIGVRGHHIATLTSDVDAGAKHVNPIGHAGVTLG